MDNDISKFFEEKTYIRNCRPCNSPEDIKATIELNEHMKRVQEEFRSKSAMSRMVVEGFRFPT